MTSSPIGQQAENLRKEARAHLQNARSNLDHLVSTGHVSPQDRANWYATVQQAARDNVLTPAQIQEAARLSRQRYWQITRAPLPGPKPTEAQLPKEDL